MNFLIFLMILVGDMPSAPKMITPKTEGELMIMGNSLMLPMQALDIHVEELQITALRETLELILKVSPNMVYLEARELENDVRWFYGSRGETPEEILLVTKSQVDELKAPDSLKFQFKGQTIYEFSTPIYTSPGGGGPYRQLIIRFGLTMEAPKDQSLHIKTT